MSEAPEPEGPKERARRRLLRRVEQRIHEVALHAMGITAADRRDVVEAMFLRRRRDAVGYWLQLLLSMAIATFGLALNSTAVVIGAMLISPLMAPIVELGMGMVVGSPVLTLRSFARTVSSVAAAVGGAALLTLLLPFHELTPEITSRTAPTVLDLSIAIFVALAAVFTTVRSTSETTSAAAGTAIGIALVPPLCVIGFGLGTRDLQVAGGASLLFITNLSAIVLIAVVSFLLLGFELVETDGWEQEAMDRARPDTLTQRTIRALRTAFGSRYSRVLSVLVPLLLVGAVIAPLSQALDQVAWEARTRNAVSKILARVRDTGDVVQSVVSVKEREVAIRVYLVGLPREAVAMERELATRVAASTGVVPTVRVIAVPNVVAMEDLSAERAAALAPTATPGLAEAEKRLQAAIRGAWPTAQLGPLVQWLMEPGGEAGPRLVLQHLGPAAAPAVEELLGRVLSQRLGEALSVRTVALPTDTARAPAADPEGLLPAVTTLADAARWAPALRLCLLLPDTLPAPRRAAVATLRPQAGRGGRVELHAGAPEWRAFLATGACVPPPPAAPQPAAPARADTTVAAAPGR